MWGGGVGPGFGARGTLGYRDRPTGSQTAIRTYPGEPRVPRVGIEDLPDPGPFDYIVAVLSLHHVEDLGTALDKVAGLLAAGGALIVVEFAWERLEGATAEWALERLPAPSPPAP